MFPGVVFPKAVFSGVVFPPVDEYIAPVGGYSWIPPRKKKPEDDWLKRLLAEDEELVTFL